MKQATIRRVPIVDDHPFLVAGLAQALEVTHDVEALATADSLGEA